MTKSIDDLSGHARRALYIVDVQASFSPPSWLLEGIRALLPVMPSIATIELHDESSVPFDDQLRWTPPKEDKCLVAADHVFVKHGYLPTAAVIDYLRSLEAGVVYVCGIQADTCVLAAGFALFDAGMRPTLLTDLVVGSSLDSTAALGIRLWRHHFGRVATAASLLGG